MHTRGQARSRVEGAAAHDARAFDMLARDSQSALARACFRVERFRGLALRLGQRFNLRRLAPDESVLRDVLDKARAARVCIVRRTCRRALSLALEDAATRHGLRGLTGKRVDRLSGVRGVIDVRARRRALIRLGLVGREERACFVRSGVIDARERARALRHHV